jgi:hypothetical protein
MLLASLGLTAFMALFGSWGVFKKRNPPPSIPDLSAMLGSPQAVRFAVDAAHRPPPVDVTDLLTNDPAFHPNDFIAQAQRTIERIRVAMLSGNLDAARPYLTDRSFPRWAASAGADAQAAPGAGLANSVMSIQSVESLPAFDRITVLDQEWGGSSNPAATSWVFVRAASGRNGGTATSSVPVCSNCGAPVEWGASQCRFCGASIGTPGTAVLPPTWIVDDMYQAGR